VLSNNLPHRSVLSDAQHTALIALLAKNRFFGYIDKLQQVLSEP
jgi:hypothetical protein